MWPPHFSARPSGQSYVERCIRQVLAQSVRVAHRNHFVRHNPARRALARQSRQALNGAGLSYTGISDQQDEFTVTSGHRPGLTAAERFLGPGRRKPAEAIGLKRSGRRSWVGTPKRRSNTPFASTWSDRIRALSLGGVKKQVPGVALR
jgi:hypothetical protein